MTGWTPKPWIQIVPPRAEDLPGYAEAWKRAFRGEPVVLPPQPKYQPRPRPRRTVASLRAEHDELVAKRDRLGITRNDTAAARLSRGDALRENARLDRELARYAALTKRIDALAFRIRSAA